MSNEAINNMISAVAGGQSAEAQGYFQDAMNAKIMDAIEAKRIEVAQSMVQGNSDENIQTDDE